MYRHGGVPLDRFDVVVVGGGAAGLLAAVDAAESGASVVLLEKNSEVGGKTVWSAGLVTAGGTAYQRERGIEDSVEAHRSDIVAHAERMGVLAIPGVADKLGLMIDNVTAAVDRLTALGVRFSGPHPEEIHSVFRGHQFAPGIRSAVATLAQVAADTGVRIRRDTPADALLTEDGAVVGVMAGGREIRADAVILSAGDFSAAAPGRPEPPFAAHAYKQWSTGDGQFLAAGVGGELVGLDSMVFGALITVDEPLFFAHPHVLMSGAVVVDGSGARVADELATFGQGYADRTPHDLYLVLGGSQLATVATAADDGPIGRDGWLTTGGTHLGNLGGKGYAYVEDLVDSGIAVRAESLAELAETLGCDPSTLQDE
uniref:FAD-dependent oxidoreductase n=1 Tax=Pseudonocardia pini TaxID=2758030 RepID=UPI0015F0AB70